MHVFRLLYGQRQKMHLEYSIIIIEIDTMNYDVHILVM
jgi:hypothetical protein